jgi:hypothetical protein
MGETITFPIDRGKDSWQAEREKPRRLHVEYPGGICDVLSRGDRLWGIYLAERQLKEHPKNDPAKLALIAARLRRETTVTIRQIARRLYLGSWKSLNHQLHLRNRGKRAVQK